MQQIIDKLKAMRLSTFARTLTEQAVDGTCSRLSFDERLALLVDAEFAARETRTIERLRKTARLQAAAELSLVDYEVRRNLNREQVAELANCSWIERGQDLIITGPTGVGKTYLACALSERACQRKLSVKYQRLDDLLLEATYARADGTYDRFMRNLMKTKLLVVDEWLRTPVTPEHSRIIADVLDDRYERRSTIFLSQYRVKDWYDRFEEVTIGEAILDRIVHAARRMELEGESMRKRKAVAA